MPERCDVEVFADSWGWECGTCDRIEGGYASPEEARRDAQKHEVEAATQLLIDEGELP